MTARGRPWHLCDGAGATTVGRWATRAGLEAAMRAAYGEAVPAFLGRPCARPLVPRGYRHDATTAATVAGHAMTDRATAIPRHGGARPSRRAPYRCRVARPRGPRAHRPPGRDAAARFWYGGARCRHATGPGPARRRARRRGAHR